VQLTTYENFKQVTKESIQSGVIQVYKDRLVLLETRYWSHSKKVRQKYGLRAEIWDYPVNFLRCPKSSRVGCANVSDFAPTI
jgi:hypothetical protein